MCPVSIYALIDPILTHVCKASLKMSICVNYIMYGVMS